jgi:hypothetical protein
MLRSIISWKGCLRLWSAVLHLEDVILNRNDKNEVHPLLKCEVVNWIQLAHITVQQWALVNMVAM